MVNKQFIYETQKFARVDYLTGVLGRLEAEVGTVFECFKHRNTQEVGKTGFWTGIRLLMPIVESVAKTLNKKPWELLEDDLGIKTGSLVWQMFRHSLIHGDLLNHSKYGVQAVGWGIMMMGQGHIIGHNHIGIDLFTLYERLVEYLKLEIAKGDRTIIEVKVGVNYINPPQHIIDEFTNLK